MSFKKFIPVFLFIATLGTLNAAANNENNIETSSEKVQDAYFFSLLQFIQNHVRGKDTVILRNWQGEERELDGINKEVLMFMTSHAKTAAACIRMKQITREVSPHLEDLVQGFVTLRGQEKIATYERFAKTIPVLVTKHHQNQECVELNLHKTLINAMGQDIGCIEREAKTMLSAIVDDQLQR
ncbi:hypothetical protein K2W90_02420 [Candidatus Babeliales bacterium]|nr:hypothetical protein [Candidatus Babeliales bacterium]